MFVRHGVFLIARSEPWTILTKPALPAAFPVSDNTSSISSSAQLGADPYPHRGCHLPASHHLHSPSVACGLLISTLALCRSAARAIDPCKVQILPYHCSTQNPLKAFHLIWRKNEILPMANGQLSSRGHLDHSTLCSVCSIQRNPSNGLQDLVRVPLPR